MRRYGLLTGLALAAVMASGAFAEEPKLGNARAAGINISALTPAAARQRLARELKAKLAVPVTLTDGSRSLKLTRQQLGASIDAAGMVAAAKAGQAAVPLKLAVDQKVLADALKRVAPSFAFHGSNARVVERGGKVRIQPGLQIRSLDLEQSKKLVAEQLEANASALKVRVALAKKPPAVTEADLKQVTGRLARFSTRFKPGDRKRTNNIRLAVKTIDGTIVPPDGVFSVNGTVGPRTHERGYRTAAAFKAGKIGKDVGGGLSQVTGTLFNAALLAGLPIVEYRTHQRPVDYIPIGRDATVWYGGFDMKFRNPTSAPVYVAYAVEGNRLVATLYGARKPGRQVKVAVSQKKRGPRHITAELYRTVMDNGKVVAKEKVGSSEYRWKPD